MFTAVCISGILIAGTGLSSDEVPAPIPQPGPGPTAPPKPTDPQPEPPPTPQPPLMPGSPRNDDLTEPLFA